MLQVVLDDLELVILWAEADEDQMGDAERGVLKVSGEPCRPYGVSE